MSSVLETVDQVVVQHDRDAFNLAVWDKLIADSELAALPWRIETDEHGQVIMSPPPAPAHGNSQSEIARLLGNWNPGGKVITECPISTRKGVKAADVAWCSTSVWEATEGKSCFVTAPEICVEVISPSNTASEIAEKKTLYFEKGAKEVWLVSVGGEVSFYPEQDQESAVFSSSICPEFPAKIS